MVAGIRHSYITAALTQMLETLPRIQQEASPAKALGQALAITITRANQD